MLNANNVFRYLPPPTLILPRNCSNSDRPTLALTLTLAYINSDTAITPLVKCRKAAVGNVAQVWFHHNMLRCSTLPHNAQNNTGNCTIPTLYTYRYRYLLVIVIIACHSINQYTSLVQWLHPMPSVAVDCALPLTV